MGIIRLFSRIEPQRCPTFELRPPAESKIQFCFLENTGCNVFVS